MSREKQIIGIKECIDTVYGADCAYYDVDGFAIANEIYNAGYRKQSDGEWVKDAPHWRYKCNQCGFFPLMVHGDFLPYCPNCGAQMKGD